MCKICLFPVSIFLHLGSNPSIYIENSEMIVLRGGGAVVTVLVTDELETIVIFREIIEIK